MNMPPDPSPPVSGHDAAPRVPPWATDELPDVGMYAESELFVAGALSTMPPFDVWHPAWALPFARRALWALAEWEPTDA